MSLRKSRVSLNDDGITEYTNKHCFVNLIPYCLSSLLNHLSLFCHRGMWRRHCVLWRRHSAMWRCHTVIYFFQRTKLRSQIFNTANLLKLWNITFITKYWCQITLFSTHLLSLYAYYILHVNKIWYILFRTTNLRSHI